jgi:hypothetical protein
MNVALSDEDAIGEPHLKKLLQECHTLLPARGLIGDVVAQVPLQLTF